MADTDSAIISYAPMSDSDNIAMENVLPPAPAAISLQPRMTGLMTTSCFDALRRRLGIGRQPPIHPACRKCRACSTS